MRLSEAMRLGIKATPPIYGPVFQRSECETRVCGACAIGTPLYAVHGDAVLPLIANDPIGNIARLYAEQWPWTAHVVEHPEHPDNGYRHSFVALVISLFESEDWTRERIADWIEGLERVQEAERLPREASSEAAVAVSVK